MNKIFCSLIILIGFNACEPFGTVDCIVSNYTNNKVKIAGMLQYGSILEINPDTSLQVYISFRAGHGILSDSILFINRITIKDDSVFCKKNWKDVKTWVIINKGKRNNEYTLNLYDADF